MIVYDRTPDCYYSPLETRLLLNLTQQEMDRLLGVSVGTWWRIENGEIQLTALLGYALSWLVACREPGFAETQQQLAEKNRKHISLEKLAKELETTKKKNKLLRRLQTEERQRPHWG